MCKQRTQLKKGFVASLTGMALLAAPMVSQAAVTSASGVVTLDFSALTGVIDTNAPLAIGFLFVMLGVSLVFRLIRRVTGR